MEKTQFSFTIERKEKDHLEKMAQSIGITLTDLLKEGARFYSGFDPFLRERVKNFSRNLGIAEHLVLQNLAISWMAKREAHAEVFGFDYPVLDEFMFTENGAITGEQLFNILKADQIKSLEDEKEGRLLRESQYGPISNEQDAEWLKKRLEKREHAAEAQKRVKENRENGLAYSFSDGEDEAKILAEMKARREKAGIK
ncbi:MAG TPA: hypothetical protein PLB96_10060 [Syntrophales bacterium]|nr:hypothetical protein [Syntrophales bacterium]